ncbi:hypothetical protein BC829DRAFT_302691 [Chytridium lagenaria]|nr:hypothetical protein BC829DRAFT_302691 [Chytridium lagenaria]
MFISICICSPYFQGCLAHTFYLFFYWGYLDCSLPPLVLQQRLLLWLLFDSFFICTLLSVFLGLFVFLSHSPCLHVGSIMLVLISYFVFR